MEDCGTPTANARVALLKQRELVHDNAEHARPFRGTSAGPSNTGDKLRGARPSTLVLDDSRTAERAAYHAVLRLQPPLVCFIPLFDAAP